MANLSSTYTTAEYGIVKQAAAKQGVTPAGFQKAACYFMANLVVHPPTPTPVGDADIYDMFNRADG